MRRGTPIASICSIALGSAASEEAVENAINAGSFTAPMNRASGIRAMRAIGSSTITPNSTSAPYNVNTRMPRLCRTLRPTLPTVNASAAPMPKGANFMTTPVNLNITSASASQKPSMVSLGRPRTCVSPIANKTDQNTT